MRTGYDIGPKIILVCEGRNTEPQYFQLLNKQNPGIGKINTELKRGFDKNNTHRPDLIRIANSEYLYQHGVLDIFKETTFILYDLFYELKENGLIDQNDEDLCEDFRELRRNIVTEYESSNNIKRGDPVNLSPDYGPSYEFVMGRVKNFLKGKPYNILFEFKNQYKLAKVRDSSDADDRFYVIYDRDYDPHCPWRRTEKEYTECFDRCLPDIDIILTTPFFEYWLFLHHQNIDLQDIDYSLQSKYKIERELMVAEKDRCYSDDWEDEDVDEYYKDVYKTLWDSRYTKYYSADYLKNVKDHLKDLELPKNKKERYCYLLDHVGTNLLPYIEEMLEKRSKHPISDVNFK